MLWLLLCCTGQLIGALPFWASWNTGSNETIVLPLTVPVSNLTIIWGDGKVDIINESVSVITHQYTNNGLHSMEIHGDLYGFRFDSGPGAEKLSTISSWGDGFFIDNTSTNAFAGCVNLQVLAPPTDQPVFLPGATLAGMFMNTSINSPLEWDLTNVVSLDSMFLNATKLNQAINFSNTQEVTTTANMFAGATNFNSPVVLDTVNVTDMTSMFQNTQFNQPVDFETANVKSMSWMFAATPFNQALAFDASSLVQADNMFRSAAAFNSPINFANTQMLTNTSGMFRDASAFNQPITFQTDNVQDMNWMFDTASSFNQPVNFNTQNVQFMTYMFANTDTFNQSINFNGTSLVSANWMFRSAIAFDSPVNLAPTLALTSTSGMFLGAIVFNQPITFSTDSVTDMSGMFGSTKLFNQPVNFSTGKVTTVQVMFANAVSFNQPVTITSPDLLQVDYMFANAIAFNSPINISSLKLQSAANMFQGATSFNQPVILKTDAVVTMAYMFFACPNFNQPINFNTTAVRTMSRMFAQASVFNQPIAFDGSNLVAADCMFQYTGAFNSPVNITNTQMLTTTRGMFRHATAFNQPIAFQTNNVNDMGGMFDGAKSFNRAVNFNTQKVQFMTHMFANTDAFNQPINFNATNLTSAVGMFESALAFDSPVNLTSAFALESTEFMFSGAAVFNKPITFRTDSVVNMRKMFYGAAKFNQPLSNNPPQTFFVTRNVLHMDSMLEEAASFNQAINFQATNLTSATNMFAGAASFNQPVVLSDAWQLMSMSGMFANASKFNQTVNISTTSAEDMDDMFAGAVAFEQSLATWDTSKVTNCSSFCFACGLPSFPACDPCGTTRRTSARGASVCNCPSNEINVTFTKCEIDLCKRYKIPPELHLECIGRTPPTPAPGPSPRAIIIISPLFNITEESLNSSEFVFTLPIDPRVYNDVGTVTQSCYGRELSCQWLDPATNQFRDSGCIVSQTNVDMGLGIVGTQCTCTHLTVFAIALRSDLKLAPLCHAEDVDYALIALYSILALGLIVQLGRLLFYRLSKASTVQHALLLIVCVLRIAYLVAKPLISLPGLVFLGLLPSAIALTLFVALLLTWASLQSTTFDRSPFSRFRIPFLATTGLVFAVVIAMVIAVAATSDMEVVQVGSYILAALYAVVCCLVLASGLGLRHAISNNNSSAAPHSSTGDWRVMFRSRLLIATLALSASLFVAACLWVAAVQEDIVTSSAATLATTAVFYLFDWLSLCVMTWLLFRAVSEGAKKKQHSRPSTSAGASVASRSR